MIILRRDGSIPFQQTVNKSSLPCKSKVKSLDRSRKLCNELWLPGEKGCGGRDRLEVWDCHVHSAIFKIENQQDLLCSTGNSAQYFIIT